MLDGGWMEVVLGGSEVPERTWSCLASNTSFNAIRPPVMLASVFAVALGRADADVE